jgi:hypothetical protein
MALVRQHGCKQRADAPTVQRSTCNPSFIIRMQTSAHSLSAPVLCYACTTVYNMHMHKSGYNTALVRSGYGKPQTQRNVLLNFHTLIHCV